MLRQITEQDIVNINLKLMNCLRCYAKLQLLLC